MRRHGASFLRGARFPRGSAAAFCGCARCALLLISVSWSRPFCADAVDGHSMHRHASVCQCGRGDVVGRSGIGVSDSLCVSFQGVQYIVDEEPFAWRVTGEAREAA